MANTTILILSAVIVAQGLLGLAVALIVHSDRQRLADLKRRLESADAAYNRLANDAIGQRGEIERLELSLSEQVTGGCDKHARLPMPEFLRRGGSECPVCLKERNYDCQDSTTETPKVVGTIRSRVTAKPNPILPTGW